MIVDEAFYGRSCLPIFLIRFLVSPSPFFKGEGFFVVSHNQAPLDSR